jgi:MFS family permease
VDPNIRRLGYIGALRATGLSLVLPYVALYLRNVLGIDFLSIGLLLAVLGVAPILIVPFGGLITDRLGRRPLIVVSLCAEAASITFTGVAMLFRSEPGVIAAALATSLSGTFGGPALSAYVADLAVGSDRTQGFTYLRIGWNVGFAVGVASAGFLLGSLGFAGVGLVAGGLLIVSTAVLVAVLDPSPYDRERSARPRGGAGGVSQQRSVRESVAILVGDRVFLAVCVVVGVAWLSVGQWSTTFPLYVNSVLRIPYAVLGLGFALNGVLVVLAQGPTTKAAIGHRHTTLIALGVVLYVVGFLLLGAVALVPFALLLGFFVSVVILTMGENVLSIPTSTLPSNLAPPLETGAYNGTFAAIVGIGQVLAPTFGGAVLAVGLAPPVTWLVLMLPAVPALLVNRLWIDPRILDRANRA